jgi:catechol 2,3-dioxygenase-like lactoylglutathione lyase family enzyme
MGARRWLTGLMALAVVAMPAAASAQPAGRITGIGGVFITSKDPKALVAWYRDVLGIDIAGWGGAVLRTDAPGHPPAVAFTVFRAGEAYLKPSAAPFMIDFAVDDLDAFIARLKAKGVTVLARDDSDPSGSFAWVLDPDGTKVELWQPKPAAK